MAANSESSNKPFRFLDLPLELRLRVYEFLPVTTRHVQIYWKSVYRGTVWCRIVVRTMPLSILATSRRLNAEASTIINPQLEKLTSRPPQFIFDWVRPIRFRYELAMGILARALRQDKSMSHINLADWESQKYAMERLALSPGFVAIKKKERALLWKFLVQLHKRYIRHVSDPTNRADEVAIQLAIDTSQANPFLLNRNTRHSWPYYWPSTPLESWTDAVVYSATRLARHVPPQDGLIEVVSVLANGKVDTKGLQDLHNPTESAKEILRSCPIAIPKTIAEDAFMEGEKYL